MSNSTLSKLPAVDKLLDQATVLVDQYGRPLVTSCLREVLNEIRSGVQAGKMAIPNLSVIIEMATVRLKNTHAPSLKRVINLTGTVLHTNLGRAPLPTAAIESIVQVAAGYSNLEYDLQQGQRGDRDTHIESLIKDITGAEAATVVNNNAAAVLLTLNTLALQKEVPVSRGELVEIGGSFRIPEVMQRAGCHLVEVGSTNRTHESDYENAITANTALLMKVHTSNYEIMGFTQDVSDEQVARIAAKHNLPFVTDLGSGTLIDLRHWGLPYEPTVQATLDTGADVITFSGDKLLGGPQCGIIVGKEKFISQIKSNPMKRALRVDKMTVAALFEVLRLYLDPDSLAEQLPTLHYLSKSVDKIKQMVDIIVPRLNEALGGFADVSGEACESQIGSGSLPISLLPSYALKITPYASDRGLTDLASSFRSLQTPIIGRIRDGSLYFDLRTLDNADLFLMQIQDLNQTQ
ncbi:MAG: L-seryl-tRNA(Sec) selenium transferase [bacterium]|nr:L-seryl-tRNA(Sec) selenium transferase [Gammaproteobacteria bacterium]